MTIGHVRSDEPAEWVGRGVFQGLRHFVVVDAVPSIELDGWYTRREGLAGATVWFADCGAACWPPDEHTAELPWCPTCRRARTRRRRTR